jgi:ABC-2 type transport system permease protein
MAAALELFAASAMFSYRAMFLWRSPSAYIFSKVGFPLLQMTLFSLIGAFGGSQPFSFYVLGNAMFVAYRPMFPVATTVASERWFGTLPYFVAAPANRVVVYFSRAVVHIFDGLQSIVVAFVLAVFVFGLDLSGANWVGLGLAMVVACYGSAAMGLLLGSAAYVVLDAAFLANTGLMALLLLTGANVPVSELPPALQTASAFVPMTRSIAAARAFAAGGSLEASLPLLAGDVLLGAVWATVGLLLLRWVETQARRRGTLEGL